MERRDFVKAASAGPFLGSVLGANDRITIGQIGLGSRGYYETTITARNSGVDLAAVCDVFQPLADMTKQKVGGKTEAYTDFRRILERKDIDAVFVSTPDHWHAPISIMACQAGKDVYCEKPLSHTVEEGRRMVQAARKHNRIFQVGSQQRSAPHFAKCAELVQSGYIGEVSDIDCWIVSNEYPQGFGHIPDSAAPTGLDWDLYLGPAPKTPYNRNRYIWNWRWFWDYSGGNMTDWGAHHIDSIHQIMNVTAPKGVSATGARMLKDNRDTPDSFLATFEYPGFTVRFANSQVGMRMDRYAGTIFYGTKGTLFVDRNGYQVIPSKFSAIVRSDVDQVEEMLASRRREVTGEKRPRGLASPAPPLCEPIEVTGLSLDPEIQIVHVQKFLDAVKSRQRPFADVEVGHTSIVPCHLANIAYRTGRTIRWDAQKEEILGDREASRQLTKQYRAPWSLPAPSAI
ncbi:Gfo/Idh/MocA family protein [Paludibaculum fermentans]|uniref:Gfo/Idh/MocA family oxidoreductase n=1 Tax=Paludibaculum fermentans TaxID=1473598 RepID=A0A7S7NMF2_PALFE|nr:Gfo/Idh/MocA family oxidoreductase [Paludibaculum fermentans]QOY85814.1 Gfo/Idh/MocA family oxidoreductase [Paludibaculum fermentans]